MKLTVRDSVTQVGNHTSKSEASIQSRTALNAGETESSVTDQMEAGQRREYKDTRDFLDTRTSSRRRCQYQEGEELRKCCNKADRCFCTTTLFKSQDWYSTGHGSRTPLQDDGDKPMKDLAQSLQTWYVHTQTWYEHTVASLCAHKDALICAETLVELRNRNRNIPRNGNRQLSALIVNIETDAQTVKPRNCGQV